MIRKTPLQVLAPVLSAAVLSIALAGCGGNTAGETTTAQAPAEAPAASTQTNQTGAAAPADNHDAEIQATMAKFFPGAQLSPKPFPFDETVAAHMGEEAGVKFSGEEGKWQVFDATQNGQRVGLAIMTHSALPDGKDMHIAFAVNPKLAVTHVTALDAPDNAKMQSFATQLVGKTHDAAFKVGKDLKAPADLSPQVAQITADAVHKGVVILEENFNPMHGEQEHSAGTVHTEGDGHSH